MICQNCGRVLKKRYTNCPMCGEVTTYGSIGNGFFDILSVDGNSETKRTDNEDSENNPLKSIQKVQNKKYIFDKYHTYQIMIVILLTMIMLIQLSLTLYLLIFVI